MKGQAKTYHVFIVGEDRYISCSEGQTLLQALTAEGILLEANCGGRGNCGKCRVRVLQGRIVDKGGHGLIPDKDGNYLGCQAYPQSDVTIELKKLQASTKGQVAETFATDNEPLFWKIAFAPNYGCHSLQEMIQNTLGTAMSKSSGYVDANCFGDWQLLKQITNELENGTQLLTFVLFANKVIAVEAGDTTNTLLGVAFDIGTTTVVGMLVNLSERRVIAVHSETNPQAAFGADVISRIEATHSLTGGLEGQAVAIRGCLNRIIKELCAVSDVSANNIYGVTIAGNSTMTHLFLEISPSALGRNPYTPVFKNISPFDPGDIDLAINPHGKVIVLPNIASFIGADTTAAVLAVDQDISNKSTLLVDLGTNGEMVLHYKNKLYACSTAAGPAFEGAHIRDGMRATAGAITEMAIYDDVKITVSGDVRPTGICGSGMVKAVAELLKAGIIDSSGRFNKTTENWPPALAQRLKNQAGQWEFVLVKAKDSRTGADISVTQADIRQIQLVKSSICTGIQFLCAHVSKEDKVQVLLAGAFGNFIDINSAVAIGMFPDCDRDDIRSVGNAAGTGAVQALLSAEKLRRCMRIAQQVEYLDLATQPKFQDAFVNNLSFP